MAYGVSQVGQPSKKRSKREAFSRGVRLLSADKAHHEALLAALDKEGRMKAYSHGANFFEDRGDFPFYVYVTRTADGKPLGQAECDLLDALLAQTDRTAPMESQSETPPGTKDVAADDHWDVFESIASQLQSRIDGLEEQVKDIAGRLIRLNRAFEEMEHSLTQGFDRVMQGLTSEISVLASDQVRERADMLAKGDRAFAEQLAADYEKLESKEKALENDVLRLRTERDRCMDRITELELELAEKEHDLSVSRAAPRTSWTRDELELLEVLSHFQHCEGFRRGLRELVPAHVSTGALVDVLRSLAERSISTHHEHANTKAITRKGKPNFYELRCNLGPCGDAGRLYYDVKDGVFVLLGFGYKDTQEKDLDAIFRSL
ncbi:MAG: hypothetical protein HRF45_09440 [Fimbriimonadia bacterium]|jgi:hypothetical protein